MPAFVLINSLDWFQSTSKPLEIKFIQNVVILKGISKNKLAKYIIQNIFNYRIKCTLCILIIINHEITNKKPCLNV